MDQEPSSEASRKSNHVFVVLNPVAGVTDTDNARDLISAFCDEQGWECEIHETKADEDLRGVIKKAVKDGANMVLVAGGDGTVSSAVNGVINTDTPLGIIPTGTGNALARDLGIPLTVKEALALFGKEHNIQSLDAMLVSEKYYVLNVSIGISAETMLSTPRQEKRRFGMFAYLWRAVGSVIRSRMHRFTVSVDDRKVRFSASEVMIANDKLLGLQPQIEGVDIKADDGRLDMFIVRAQSARDYLNVLFRFLLRRQPHGDPNLRYIDIKDKIEIRANLGLPVQADGEVIGKTPVEIKLVPQALKVIVPIKKDQKR